VICLTWCLAFHKCAPAHWVVALAVLVYDGVRAFMEQLASSETNGAHARYCALHAVLEGAVHFGTRWRTICNAQTFGHRPKATLHSRSAKAPCRTKHRSADNITLFEPCKGSSHAQGLKVHAEQGLICEPLQRDNLRALNLFRPVHPATHDRGVWAECSAAESPVRPGAPVCL